MGLGTRDWELGTWNLDSKVASAAGSGADAATQHTRMSVDMNPPLAKTRLLDANLITRHTSPRLPTFRVLRAAQRVGGSRADGPAEHTHEPAASSDEPAAGLGSTLRRPTLLRVVRRVHKLWMVRAAPGSCLHQLQRPFSLLSLGLAVVSSCGRLSPSADTSKVNIQEKRWARWTRE